MIVPQEEWDPESVGSGIFVLVAGQVDAAGEPGFVAAALTAGFKAMVGFSMSTFSGEILDRWNLP
jgi:hypothetical protein